MTVGVASSNPDGSNSFSQCFLDLRDTAQMGQQSYSPGSEKRHLLPTTQLGGQGQGGLG